MLSLHVDQYDDGVNGITTSSSVLHAQQMDTNVCKAALAAAFSRFRYSSRVRFSFWRRHRPTHTCFRGWPPAEASDDALSALRGYDAVKAGAPSCPPGYRQPAYKLDDFPGSSKRCARRARQSRFISRHAAAKPWPLAGGRRRSRMDWFNRDKGAAAEAGVTSGQGVHFRKHRAQRGTDAGGCRVLYAGRPASGAAHCREAPR